MRLINLLLRPRPGSQIIKDPAETIQEILPVLLRHQFEIVIAELLSLLGLPFQGLLRLALLP